MLSKEANELLTRIGPGTPMGAVMRDYWVPALLSSELPSPDCDPVRVMLLGEKLIAFRDTNGKVGLVADACPHRGASMWFGRNEECGLRCVYHGWKFDIDGNCTDMPNEPAESNFKHKVKITSYPTRERGGMVWTYMGARTTLPELSDLEPNMLPDDDTYVNAYSIDCNWVQALEGDIDTCHLGFLHFGAAKAEDSDPRTMGYYVVKDRAPHYTVVDTEYGAMYGAYRPGRQGETYWRIAQFLFPFHVMIPTNVLGLQVMVHTWVPLDDGHTMYYIMAKKSDRIVNSSRDLSYLPQGTGWQGRWQINENATNDYLVDRDKQRRHESYTGIRTIRGQDKAMTESMGTIQDRTIEHLGTSDTMVIHIRRRLMKAARDLTQNGIAPPGADNPAAFRVRSGGVFLPDGADWIAGTENLRKAFADHPELDPSIA